MSIVSAQEPKNLDCPDTTDTEHPGRVRRQRPKRQRRFWFRLITVAVPAAVLWGIPETMVRILDPPLGAYRAIYFGDDPNSPSLIMTDPRLHWKLRPNCDVQFLDRPVRTDRHGFRSDPVAPDGRRVLCLGDSTTFGWRVGQTESFPSQLQALLQCSGGFSGGPAAGPWQVINAGVPGYSSLQTRLQAERLIPAWQPEVVVVCVGNNEAWPVERSDRRLHEDRRILAAIEAWCSSSRFVVWLAEKVRPKAPKLFFAPSLSDAVPRVGQDQYAANLRQIVGATRRAGARIVLVAPPANLYSRPSRLEQFPDWDRWKGYYLRVKEMLRLQQRRAALTAMDQAMADDPDNFHLLNLKGLILTNMGSFDAGRQVLEQSFENHPFPMRSKLSYRRTVARIARDEKTDFIDANAVFIARNIAVIPKDLYLDQCHPTPEGHHLIAEALAKIILRPVDEPTRSQDQDPRQDRRPAPAADLCGPRRDPGGGPACGHDPGSLLARHAMRVHLGRR